jgi:hypothetical protein
MVQGGRGVFLVTTWHPAEANEENQQYLKS